MSNLKLQLKSILNLVDPQSRIFYIDYPVHNNVGDLLINLGTEHFFLDHGLPIYRRYSVLDMPSISDIKHDKNITFLCHGGGNFGDLYPEQQNIREWLIDNFPEARIIFLPQSLYYSSPKAQQISLAKIAKHPNCHILVRDKESFDTLRDSRIAHISMMPDMAHQLWGILSAISPLESSKDIYILRKDKEATPVPVELADVFADHSVDWSNIISIRHRALARCVYYVLRAGGHITPARLNVRIWYSVRDAIIHDAVTLFSSHRSVYTNRLHAMLLALLLGRDVTAFDNSYGKLSRYINAWLLSGHDTTNHILL